MPARKTETPDFAETLAALEWHRKHNYEALKALVEAELADSQARRSKQVCASVGSDEPSMAALCRSDAAVEVQ